MSALLKHLCWSRFVVWLATLMMAINNICTVAQESNDSMLTLGAVFPQENVSEFRRTMERAIADYKNDYPNISVNPLTVTPGNNPQEMLNETCESLAGTNIAALLVVGEARTFQILSLYGAHLGIPVVGISLKYLSSPQKLDIPLVVRLEPAFGHQAHAIVTLLERNVLYSFAALVIGQTSMDYEFMAKLHNLTSGVHWQASKKISLARDDESLSRHLMNLKQSNCRAFVLHGSPSDVRRVFRVAKTLGLTGSNHAWILTQAAVTTSQHILEDYPVGAVAVRYSDDTLTDKIYDGTFLLMDSFNKVNRDYNGNGALQRRKGCCDASDSYNEKFRSEDYYKPLSSAKSRHVLHTKTRSRGSLIQFDQNGMSTRATYDLLDLKREDDGHMTWADVGQWDDGTLRLKSGAGDNLVLFAGSLGKKRIVTIAEKPFTYVTPLLDSQHPCNSRVKCLIPVENRTTHKFTIETTNDDNLYQYDDTNSTYTIQCCEGLVVDLMEAIATDLGLEYELYHVADSKYGSNVNGTWNGMVRDLMDGKAEMAIGPISATMNRYDVIDFTEPFAHSGIGIIVAKRTDSPRLTWFLETLRWDNWLMTFVTLHFVAVVITIFEWFSPYGLHPRGRGRNSNFGFPSALVNVWSILFSHTVYTKPPKSWSSRWVINFWGAFSFIFLGSYTANLASFMVAQDQYYNLAGLHDQRLISGPLLYGVARGTSIETYLEERTLLTKKKDRFIPVNITEFGIRQLKKGEIDAFFAGSNLLEYHIANDPECEIVKVGNVAAAEGYAFGVRKGSALKNPVSSLILHYSSNGYLDELTQKWYSTGSCHKKKRDPNEEKRQLGVKHAEGLALFMIAGIGLSMIVLVLEYAVYFCVLPCLKRRKCKRWMPVSQRLHRAVNKDDLAGPKSALKEMANIVKRGQFYLMFEKDTLIKLRQQRAAAFALQNQQTQRRDVSVQTPAKVECFDVRTYSTERKIFPDPCSDGSGSYDMSTSDEEKNTESKKLSAASAAAVAMGDSKGTRLDFSVGHDVFPTAMLHHDGCGTLHKCYTPGGDLKLTPNGNIFARSPQYEKQSSLTTDARRPIYAKILPTLRGSLSKSSENVTLENVDAQWNQFSFPDRQPENTNLPTNSNPPDPYSLRPPELQPQGAACARTPPHSAPESETGGAKFTFDARELCSLDDDPMPTTDIMLRWQSAELQLRTALRENVTLKRKLRQARHSVHNCPHSTTLW
ncbi:glutamate receptor ionotropic, NMDA 3A-like isoform X1 [Branchiostoma floridae x Branchiostoma japonicum]